MKPGTITSVWRRFSVTLFSVFLVGKTLPAAAQSGGILSSSIATVIAGETTKVLFQLNLAGEPDIIPTSPVLQRWTAAGWANLAALRDDGTGGDSIPGDGSFSATIQIQEDSLGDLVFRSTSAYRRLLRRVPSNTVTLNVAAPLGIRIHAGASEIHVVLGESQNVALAVDVSNGTGIPIRVENHVSISPASGLAMSSDYPDGGWVASSSQAYVFNQSFEGLDAGTYTVRNTASLPEQGLEDSVTMTVRVLAPGGDPRILALGSVPDALAPGVPAAVVFTAAIEHFALAPEFLTLHGPDGSVIGALRDNGANGDLAAGDFVYSARLLIQLDDEGAYEFKAHGQFSDVGGRESPPLRMVGTMLPTVPDAANIENNGARPGGDIVVCDELMVRVDVTLDTAAILTLAESVGAAVVGSIPGLGAVQLRLADGGCGMDALLKAAAVLSDMPGVLTVEPNGVVTTDALVPDDPHFGSQYAPTRIRADETWIIARGGGRVIAVLDTGVDRLHPDFAGKVLTGFDFIDLDSDAMDDHTHSHGTHVAGIAAAHGNNGFGITGIAWDSHILPVKVLDWAGWGSWAQVAAGIKFAADAGATVINLSLSGPSPSSAVQAAVEYAATKGALIVAAAGNAGSTSPLYPAAYSQVFSVGSTTSTDARSSFSNYGLYVDIAAPGSSILSTLRGGGVGMLSGTSMAAPCVAGAAAVVWSRFPSYSAAQVRARLSATADPLPGSGMGAGRVDLFEAVFNGSFENGTRGWTAIGTAGAIASLGPLAPTDRKAFGFASSGPDDAEVQTTLEQSFLIQPGVTSFRLTFDYNFVTEEYPEWVHRGYNDNMRISLFLPGGSEVTLAYEDVDSSIFYPIAGIDFPGGDHTTGHTGWKTASATVPVSHGPGLYRIVVRDEGDGIYDSNVLIDRIRFR